jgi:galactoside O-acetyltransferase
MDFFNLPNRALSRYRRMRAVRSIGSLGQGAWLGDNLLVIGGHNIAVGSGFKCWRNCVLAACDDGRVTIGDRVSFNHNVYVNACIGGNIRIGSNVMIGPNVVMRASDHVTLALDALMADQGHTGGEIVVDDDVWIGANVTLVSGSHVRSGAVVAAGAVVTGEVPPDTIVGGVPARVIKERGDRPAAETGSG